MKCHIFIWVLIVFQSVALIAEEKTCPRSLKKLRWGAWAVASGLAVATGVEKWAESYNLPARALVKFQKRDQAEAHYGEILADRYNRFFKHQMIDAVYKQGDFESITHEIENYFTHATDFPEKIKFGRDQITMHLLRSDLDTNAQSLNSTQIWVYQADFSGQEISHLRIHFKLNEKSSVAEINQIDFGNANESYICAAAYAYISNLVWPKPRVVSYGPDDYDGTNELKAMLDDPLLQLFNADNRPASKYSNSYFNSAQENQNLNLPLPANRVVPVSPQ